MLALHTTPRLCFIIYHFDINNVDFFFVLLYIKEKRERIFMGKRIFTITKIEGDYAYLSSTEDGEELFIALALLPIGADLGSTLEYENFEFSLCE